MGRFPPLEEAMEEAGLMEVQTYISRRQKKFTQLITTRIIMGPCLAAEKLPVSWVDKSWWEQ